MNTLSVIIPVYNGSRYIDSLLKCIMRQTFRDLELVFVDDGSTDESSSLIREVCSRNGIPEEGPDAAFSNEKTACYRLITQSNQGQGEARNTGIDNSTGKYIAFIDQDDHFEPDYLEQLVCKAESCGADVVLTGYREIYQDGRVRNSVKLKNAGWCRFMNITPWGKIYRRDFLCRNKIRFQPLVLGEDIYFNLQVYQRAAVMVHLEYIGYDWIVNEESLSRTSHRSLNGHVTLFPLLEALTALPDFSAWQSDEMISYFFLKTCIYHLLISAHNSASEDIAEYRRELFAWMKQYFPGFEKNRLIRLTKPDGELFKVRMFVCLYMALYRLGLDQALLKRI